MHRSPRAPNILRFLRSALGPGVDGPSDAALLARFAQYRDESAFELLVWRHSAMVLRVGRSLLRDEHAAEDVCQATFLALARQAASIGRSGTVAGWLYRVARRIAGQLMVRRRKNHVSSALDVDQLSVPNSEHEPAIEAEIAQVLHDELDRLPEKYRVPLLLCYFDGLSVADAASRLGWPVGTVAGRASRGRERLRRRLISRGIAVPAAGLVASSAPSAGSALPPKLMRELAHAAAAFADHAAPIPEISEHVRLLAKGAIRAMTVTKVQRATGILAICCAMALGGAWASAQRRAGEPPAIDRSPAPAAREQNADSAQRRRSMNNLKQIVLAFHNYESTFGCLPFNILDKNGRPLLSCASRFCRISNKSTSIDNSNSTNPGTVSTTKNCLQKCRIFSESARKRRTRPTPTTRSFPAPAPRLDRIRRWVSREAALAAVRRAAWEHRRWALAQRGAPTG